MTGQCTWKLDNFAASLSTMGLSESKRKCHLVYTQHCEYCDTIFSMHTSYVGWLVNHCPSSHQNLDNGHVPLRAALYKGDWTPCRVRTVSVTFVVFMNNEAIHSSF